MNWLESKLGQVIAIGTILVTIGGFGYTGAEYIQRIEALESQATISYEEDINSIKSQLLVVEEKIQKLQLIDSLSEEVSNNNKEWALLREQYLATKQSLEKDINEVKSKLEKDKNPLSK